MNINVREEVTYNQARRSQLDFRHIVVELERDGHEIPAEVVMAIGIKFMFGIDSPEETRNKLMRACNMRALIQAQHR